MPKSPSLALIHVYDAIERVELLRDLTVEDLDADWLKRVSRRADDLDALRGDSPSEA